MNINLTLFGQMITFAIFVWFTMRFVWPPITKALHDRQVKIAEGLEAAERSVRDLEVAQKKADKIISDAKEQIQTMLEQANKRGEHLVDEAKQKAREEGQRLLALARSEIEQEALSARDELRSHVASLAMMGAQKVLQRNIDAAANSALLDQLIDEI